MSGDKNFDRETLERALAELGRRAFAAGRTVEIVIYGGSALLLTLNRQINTGDVDAVFEGNKDFIRKLAAEIAEEFEWDENWLNDGVKGWLSNRDADPDVKALFKSFGGVAWLARVHGEAGIPVCDEMPGDARRRH